MGLLQTSAAAGLCQTGALFRSHCETASVLQSLPARVREGSQSPALHLVISAIICNSALPPLLGEWGVKTQSLSFPPIPSVTCCSDVGSARHQFVLPTWYRVFTFRWRCSLLSLLRWSWSSASESTKKALLQLLAIAECSTSNVSASLFQGLSQAVSP